MKLIAALALIACSWYSPAYAQVSILSALSDDREAVPGQSYDGKVLVRNDTNERQEVKLYQSDYQFYADGTNRFDLPGSHSRSNAPWLSVSDTRITIEPGRAAEVLYVVQVPNAPEACGVYWSTLFVEPLPADSPESALGSDTVRMAMTTRTALRYGIQISTQVTTSDCRNEVAFEEIRFGQDQNGVRILDVDVANTGETLLRPNLRLEFYPSSSEQPVRMDGTARRLYPETSVNHRFDLSHLPSGNYTLLIVADAGGDALFGTQVEVSL